MEAIASRLEAITTTNKKLLVTCCDVFAFFSLCRNQHTSLDWSEPSLQVSTCIEPPYAEHKVGDSKRGRLVFSCMRGGAARGSS